MSKKTVKTKAAQALGKSFPRIQFKLKYSLGNKSLRVAWSGGPSADDVKRLLESMWLPKVNVITTVRTGSGCIEKPLDLNKVNDWVRETNLKANGC